MKHLYLDDAFYFITGSTFTHTPYFNTEPTKRIILGQINKITRRLPVKLYAYSIACDHYHTLWFVREASDLPKIAQYLQGGSAFLLNKALGRQGRVWDEYYEIVINKQKVLRRVYGYIIGNLLKHKEARDFTELEKSPFSSFAQTARKIGRNEAIKLVSDVLYLSVAEVTEER